MAERERAATPPRGGVFLPRNTVMDAADLRRAVTRIAHEVVERNHGLEGLALIGLQTGGVPLAHRLHEALLNVDGTDVPVGTLDVAFYRDDIGLRPVLPEEVTDIPFELTGMRVVLVDDVLFTGRTVRAALNALNDYGRPRSVQLAVMVDRGHRQLPIRPDYVGKNLPTRFDEQVDVSTDGVVIGDVVPQRPSPGGGAERGA
jgi:pyrimidine operon attenuation protein/uracil phosphoribosyltransferase